jgi:hypothetical protein
MNLINHNNENDEESRALAACYRLLLQKAAERRARLAQANQGQESLAGEEQPNEKATA